MSYAQPTVHVTVIGAGFSGVMTAVHLLRDPSVHVMLIDRTGRFGPGLAYATPSPVHYLNVPAGNMSAFDDDPPHFLKWAHDRDPSVVTGSFVARGVYGAYLEHILAGARSAAKDRLKEVADQAVSIEPSGGRMKIVMQRSESFITDRVVLALGNAMPPVPPMAGGCDAAVLDPSHGVYLRNPWDVGALDRIRPDEPVLIIGTGLTMMDVIMSLHARDHAGKVVALSRHGLLPRPHRSPSRPPAHRAVPAAIKTWDGSAKQLLRILRREVQESANRGTDWRDVVTSIRPVTAQIWQRMDLQQRERYLSRLRSYWEIVRHRAAPETAAAVQDIVASRRVSVRAARLLSLKQVPGKPQLVEATFQPRGSSNTQSIRVARVINCLGPDTDVRRIDEPLFGNLLSGGWITPDPLGLGIEASENGAVIRADGKPDEGVFIIGPLRKAQAWENTAVPELRKQAAAIAGAVLESLKKTAARA